MNSSGFKFDTTYTTLPAQFYSRVKPEPLTSPSIILLNNSLARSLGLDFSLMEERERAALFSGTQLPEGALPFSQAYAGHQFGHFTMLGDGRAHVLGEHITPDGARVDIQYKGSGRTPYSRRGDGRAVLGPMLREYIISEAMYHLGVPTTRSLAVVTTGEFVRREDYLPGAILTRTASSHIRVGTFEFAAYLSDQKAISAILDYTIQRHYPHLMDSENRAVSLIQAVMHKQVDLIVHWMRVGFIHGVMNTDNMTLSGETIDYGPCAFMDAYDPSTVFSSIDQGGRYAYANQPVIAQWNIAKLAETLLPFIDEDSNQAVEIAAECIKKFPEMYKSKWLKMMRSKLGLFGVESGDEELISDLLKWMRTKFADFTNTFNDLSKGEKPTGNYYSDKGFEEWYLRWQERLAQNGEPIESSLRMMRSTNPAVIPRNHKVEGALKAAQSGDIATLKSLLTALNEPYKDCESLNPYQNPPEPSERVCQTFCGT